MNLKLASLTACIFLFIAFCIYFLNIFNQGFKIKATVYPALVTVGEPVFFTDSSSGSAKVKWEFGNGESTLSSKGKYVFSKPGNYLIRLTINGLKAEFPVHVKQSVVAKTDGRIQIFAPEQAFSGQKVHFKSIGSKITWCEWYFGASKKAESRELETFYKFSKPGTYRVKLLTNVNPKITVTRVIRIVEPFEKLETIIQPEEKPGGGEEKDKLLLSMQSIADGGDLLSIYNSIVKQHLCSNQHIKVSVNGKSPIDLYSYCHSLQLGSNLKIDQVSTETDSKTGCASKLIVQQH